MKLLVPFIALLSLFGCNPYANCDKGINKNEEFFLNQYGDPENSIILSLTGEDNLYEYQSSLYDYLIKGETLEIKEVLWEKGKYSMIIWFKKNDGEWKALYCLNWNNKKVEF